MPLLRGQDRCPTRGWYPRVASKIVRRVWIFANKLSAKKKRLGEGTRNACAMIRERVLFIESDTVMYEYMETVRQLVAEGKVLP